MRRSFDEISKSLGRTTEQIGSVAKTLAFSPFTKPTYEAATTYRRGENAIDSDEAVTVSDALLTDTDTLVELTAGAKVPLAVTAAEISQFPVPIMETSPLNGLTAQTAVLDEE